MAYLRVFREQILFNFLLLKKGFDLPYSKMISEPDCSVKILFQNQNRYIRILIKSFRNTSVRHIIKETVSAW